MDDESQPESLTVAPGGVLIVGSASTPFIYKVRPGSTTPEKFVDASAEGAGTFFFGMLADAATNTLWACQLTPVPGTTPANRHTALRGFDLSTGAESFAGTCLGTTVSATISRSDRTRRSTSATPLTAKSTGCRPARRLPNSSWKITRSTASTGSPFWMARCMSTTCSRTISTASRWMLPARPDSQSISGWISPSKGRTACAQPMASCWLPRMAAARFP